jgi:hypothetical protein
MSGSEWAEAEGRNLDLPGFNLNNFSGAGILVESFPINFNGGETGWNLLNVATKLG